MNAPKNTPAEVFGKYRRQLGAFIARRIPSREEAEDILQDVFMRFVQTDALNPVTQVAAWLFRAARNRIIDHSRKRREERMPQMRGQDDESGFVSEITALLADEAALLLGMACTGQWNWSYLPLHLCSINVFVCLYNTLTDRSWCKEELYALCIPGAALALLCPSWRDVPGWFTLINLHSVSIHALLVLYPVLLVAGGYRPSVRRVPQVLAFLFGSALPIYFLNKPLHTNFYFLNNPYGNVITSTFTAWFGEKFYILGFLPAIALALVLMYAPWAAAGKKR